LVHDRDYFYLRYLCRRVFALSVCAGLVDLRWSIAKSAQSDKVFGTAAL
jgi:hypothetical protein